MDVESISLHGHIRNTPSDTEARAEHQLRAGRSACHWERIHRTTQNSAGRRKEGETGESGELAGLDLPSVGGGTEARV